MRPTSVLPNWVFSFAKKDDAPPTVPADLSTLSDEEVVELESKLGEEFDTLHAGIAEAPVAERPQMLARMDELAEQLEKVGGERKARDQAAEDTIRQADELATRVRGATEDDGEPAEVPVEPVPVDQAAAADVAATTAEETAAEVVVASAKDPAVPRRRPKLNEIRSRAREIKPEQRETVTILASADLPDFSSGSELDGVTDIAHSMWRKGRTLGDRSGRVPIATVHREYDELVTKDSSPSAQLEMLERVRDPRRLLASLTAAGGWCAPSEIIYDLFNIADADGMLDLPTLGITRGGIQFVSDSPSLADVLGQVWTWDEADDIDAVTGTSTKPCVRVPCPTFSEVRLDGRGICITAGNLTDKAYPETTENFVRLLMAAHAHVTNKAHIDALVGLSTGVSFGGAGTGAAAELLDAVALQAVDYRAKYGMGMDSVLEVVLPDWSEELIRSDMARRRGVNAMAVSDAEIGGWFDARGVRVQLINDFQVRDSGVPGDSSAATAWPSTVDFLLYAAGTFVKGTGPTIDLGVVRDSVLNATNDHTAAWSEEFTLIAMPGHESRITTVSVCPDGTTGGDGDSPCA